MDKSDKKVCRAVLAPFGGALLCGLWCAVNGVTLLFSTSYGFESFVLGAIAGFILTLAAEIVILPIVCSVKGIKRLSGKGQDSEGR